MNVKCISVSDSNKNSQTLPAIDYSLSGKLKINGTYTVYGISLWEMNLYYLLVPIEAAWPLWYPAKLFVIQNRLLYIESYYQYFGRPTQGAVGSSPEILGNPGRFRQMGEGATCGPRLSSGKISGAVFCPRPAGGLG